MKRIFLFILIAWSAASAQNIAIGQWRIHIPYRDAIAVAEAGNRVYCASRSGLFYFEKNDNSVHRLSKITGLAEMGVATMKYNPNTGGLLVAYSNTNMDLIEGNTIYNIADIKRQNIPGKKVINNISISGDFAYISCGFGIVVLDMKRREMKDTYFFGPNGDDREALDVAVNGQRIFAATPEGIFTALLSDPNINNVNAWTKDNSIPSGVYNTIAMFSGKLYANYSKYLTENRNVQYWDTDTIYVLDGTAWSQFNTATSYLNRRIETSEGKLFVTNRFSATAYDENLNRIKVIYGYSQSNVDNPHQAIFDSEGNVWVADEGAGLVKELPGGGFQNFTPSGPVSNKAWRMVHDEKSLWIAPGGFDDAWNNIYTKGSLDQFSDNSWTSFHEFNTSGIDTVFDMVAVAPDPSDPSRVYAASWGRGLAEIKNGKIEKVYINNGSSTLEQSSVFPGFWVGVGGLAFDNAGNLWMSNHGAANPLSVKKADGSWKSFSLGGLTSGAYIGQMMIDSRGNKWIILGRGGGLVVFNDNGTIDDLSDDLVKRLDVNEGNGKLPTNNVFSISEDRDGAIWIGTDKGIAVIYSPQNIFTGNNFDAQQILIQQDGYTQVLLENETVTSIYVDGANRKWFGTLGGGAFLMSADGTVEINHFSEQNSPLLSNVITSIAIHPGTGEVFFGTERGIISYKSTATEGNPTNDGIYVYPNPVRRDFEGTIGINGLVANASVKITDISGTLIYETIAHGGQAVWNGKNFKGERANTGVYLVFVSNADGKKTQVAKLLFLN